MLFLLPLLLKVPLAGRFDSSLSPLPPLLLPFYLVEKEREREREEARIFFSLLFGSSLNGETAAAKAKTTLSVPLPSENRPALLRLESGKMRTRTFFLLFLTTNAAVWKREDGKGIPPLSQKGPMSQQRERGEKHPERDGRRGEERSGEGLSHPYIGNIAAVAAVL